MVGRKHRRWTAPRALALALALWGALGPTTAVLHLAAAPHAVCPEHGELIELGSLPALTSSIAARQGWSTAAPAENEPGLDAHLHCAASTPLRSPALSASRTAIAVEVTGPTDRVNELAAGVRLAPPCVLTCAPKQSPPSAAA